LQTAYAGSEAYRPCVQDIRPPENTGYRFPDGYNNRCHRSSRAADSEHDIQKLVADHATLRNENAVLKEELVLA